MTSVPLDNNFEFLVTRIKGVSFPNEDTGIDRQCPVGWCSPGDRLELVHDAHNAHDCNAVEVRHQSGVPVGYLPREDAPRVVAALQAGKNCGAFVLEYRPQTAEKPYAGLRVFVFLAAPELTDAEHEQRFLDWKKENQLDSGPGPLA